MAKSNKGQHYIPRCYQAAWTDPYTPKGHEPYVWIFPKDGGEGRSRAPANVFKETDMYTVTDPVSGTRDLKLEQALSRVERVFTLVRNRKLADCSRLDDSDWHKLIAFMAAMYVRTPAMREDIRQMWAPVLASGERIQANPPAKPVRSLSRATGRTMSLEDVRKIVEEPLQEMMIPSIQAVVSALSEFAMYSAICCAPAGTQFITSDAPCVWFDPTAITRAPALRAPALRYGGTEITLPLTPTRLLSITFYDPGQQYVMISPEAVGEVNRKTASFATESIISNSPLPDPIWFRRGIRIGDLFV